MIKKAIACAIKNQSWLAIEYQNRNQEITNYWIAILDVDFKTESFRVDGFNLSKMNEESSGLIEATISMNRILNATVLRNTHYNQPDILIDKIESHEEITEWLEFDSYSEGILDYIYDCMLHEETPYQTETTLIRKVDQDTFESIGKDGRYPLSLEQISDLVPKIERLSRMDEKNIAEIVTLTMNLLSISTKQGLYVVAYKNLMFNPFEKCLVLSSEIMFNYTFASDKSQNYKHHLKNYLDLDTDEFVDLFVDNPEAAKNMLEPEVLKHHETLDDRPYIMDMVRTYYAHIEKELDQIKLRKKNNDLSTPLIAFFGNMTGSLLSGRTRAVDVVLMNPNINLDQLRVIYNALTKPITYVQGPPGTGKTHTIVSVLISSFFNGDRVLVSSNNNKPINDIYEKITSFKSQDNYDFFLPFIRLGNKEETLKSLNYIKGILPKIRRYQYDDEKLSINAKVSTEQMKEINRLLTSHEERIEVVEQLDALQAMHDNLQHDLRSVALSELIQQKQKELEQLPHIDDLDVKKYVKQVDPRFLSWLFFTSIKYLRRMDEPKNENLLNILMIENDDDAMIREFNLYIKDEKNFENFQRIFPVILTTNQSAYRLGNQTDSFDLVILDEAGQSSIGYSLFPISRAKRLLLVGDQNQLKPVISIAPENNKYLMQKHQISESYNYIDNSILLTMQKVDTVSKFILLRYHYRSHRDIIGFSNQKYYHGQLKLPLEDAFKENALEHIHVDTSRVEKNNEKNTSWLEVDAIVRDIKEKQYSNVGVITPFRNQANLLREALNQAGLTQVDVGTVHTFQGDEKDVIYLSSGITRQTHEKSYDWLRNNQELINVATTRAKNRFILVSDEEQIKRRSKQKNDFNELLQYVTKNGKGIELTPSSSTYFINGANFKNYDTLKEKEFFDTIHHLLTTAEKYTLKSKVRIKSILDGFKNQKTFDYSLKGEFDLVIFKVVGNYLVPMVIIELDGNEHKQDQKVIRRDKIKKEICMNNGVELIRIDNKYSRRYMFIKELLAEILK